MSRAGGGGPTIGGAFLSSEITAGRQLFAQEWRFVAAAASANALPAMKRREIAFAGRSNVGKSSLINALTNRHGLARTSRQPGRTRELMFFAPRDDCLILVDMPGYGYATAPRTKIADWTALIQAYVAGRANLLRVFLLIDARRGLGAPDQPVLATLDAAAVSYQVVIAKADEVKAAELDSCVATIAQGLAAHPAAFPTVLATSTRSGAGIAELRAAIARLLAERQS